MNHLLDIPWEFKTNRRFRELLEHHAVSIAQLESVSGQDTSSQVAEHLAGVLRLCDYNPGLLVPYYFPHYPEKKPLSLFARPFSFAMFNLQIGGFTVIRASRQIGKCLTFNNLHKVKVKGAAESEVNTRKLFDLCERFGI